MSTENEMITLPYSDMDERLTSLSENVFRMRSVISEQLKYMKEGCDKTVKCQIVDVMRMFSPEITKLNNKSTEINNTLLEVNAMLTQAVTLYRESLEAEITKLKAGSNIGYIGSWADAPPDEELTTNTDQGSWATVTKKSKPVKTTKVETFEFNCTTTTDSKGCKWYDIRIPCEIVPGNQAGSEISLPVVQNNKQLQSLPAGMMVYNKTGKVHKISITTGFSYAVGVPLGCRVWNTQDDTTTTKYSRYNHIIGKDNGPKPESFYIDEAAANKTGLTEDRTRSFRHPSRAVNRNAKDEFIPRWAGYNVFHTYNFGDAQLLTDQLSNTTVEDASDLYQYSLWMNYVGLCHYRVRF